MPYLKRLIEPTVLDYLQTFPVIAITGPRQSGKSTLLKHLLKNYTYVNFDDAQTRYLFELDSTGFLANYANHTIFDEAQKMPSLFEAIKIAVDNDRENYGKYVLSGSSQFTLLKNISESLAGRIGLLALLPFQCSEIPKTLRAESIYKGSYPELITRNYRANKAWYSSYLDTYLSKDLRDISHIGNLRDFQRFLHLLAINTGQLFNMSNYAKELGVSVPTIKSWLSVLEASYIIFLLPPYYSNEKKRLIKSPKIYFYDTGLVAFLTAIETQEQFIKGPMCGKLFENYIIADIFKNIQHHKENAALSYYRTSNGVEIDLIIDYFSHRKLIEIKYSALLNKSWFSAINSIAMPQDQKFIIYNGKSHAFGTNQKAVNYLEYLL